MIDQSLRTRALILSLHMLVDMAESMYHREMPEIHAMIENRKSSL